MPFDPIVSMALPAIGLIGAVLVLVLLLRACLVFIPNDHYGVVERKWTVRGNQDSSSFMSLTGSPGFIPEVIRGGWHVFFPGKYRIHRKELITVRSIGYLFARDGAPLPNGQALAAWPDGVDPQDARSFLGRGGQQGPQRKMLRQGTYAINTALFVVFTESTTHAVPLGDAEKADSLHAMLESRNAFEPVTITGDQIAVVTVQDGPALDHGEIIAPTVGTDAKQPAMFHNSFQDIERFLAAGGRRGRQEQVLVEGTYYVNRLFATVEMTEKTVVKIGHVGVVVSYTGPQGVDLSGDDYKHGQLVEQGQRGVWQKPLQPGKYAMNPFAVQVREVPTTNFQLRWIQGSTDTHNFDANLSEIVLITKDAFEPILPLSIVVHIGQTDAPYVVQQFAEIGKLVDQTLDPMVSAWFKDAAQSMTLIELVNRRSELQAKALEEMRARFQKYRLNVMEVMIGTPRASVGDKHIDTVFEQLRSRQVAREKVATYESQQIAASKERELREAEAIASQQPALTASKVAIEVAANQGEAEVAKRTRDAKATVLMAEAEAQRVRLTGQAEADKIEAVGTANANAARAQVDAYGGAEVALKKVMVEILADAVKHAAQPMVPGVAMAGGGSSIPDLLMALTLARGDVGRAIGATPTA
ncbi:SPFH domain-containing protein [Acidisphaera sp. L21]|uniref:SPFH domain-containing protein n=1 Tax=Acidisphaera sp. L21 TaxID=1641851 RepID=UPI00131E09FB|nr:SPFH domain-containing protein [Acidisphaera sp. L21]